MHRRLANTFRFFIMCWSALLLDHTAKLVDGCSEIVALSVLTHMYYYYYYYYLPGVWARRTFFQAQALTTRSTMATWSFVERRILDAAGSAAVVATSRGPQLTLSEPELLRFVAAFQQDVAVEWAHMGTTQMQQIS